MIPAEYLTDTLDVVTPATATDRYGNERYDWATATTRSITARFEQQTSTEPTGDTRAALVGGWRLITNDLTVTGRDRLTYGSPAVTFEVVGPPQIQRTPDGVHHLEATARQVTG